MSPVPEWMVERLHAGDLDERTAARVRGALGGEGEARLGALAASEAEILAAHPAERVVAEIRRRRRRRAPRPIAVLLPAAILVAAAASVVLLAGRPPAPVASPPVPDVTRVKGATRLVVYRQRPAVPERLGERAPAAAGDLLQLAVQVAAPCHGVVVSVDGRGVVTRHLPESGELAAPLSPGRELRLAHAYELDDAPAFERFFLITGPRAFAAAVVEDAVRRAPHAPLLPAGLELVRFEVVKP